MISHHGVNNVIGPTCPGETEEILHPQSVAQSLHTISMALIDSRSLERECFVRCVELMYPGIQIKGFGDITEWQQAGKNSDTQIVLYNIGAQDAETEDVSAELRHLVDEVAPCPVVVLGSSEDFRQTIAVFDCGAHGYMPPSIGLHALVEAAKLSSSGGIFLPMTSVLALRNAFDGVPKRPAPIKTSLTERQLAISDALRKGKSNKTIAYEMNMCESTVKVHIRNIMKKLKASNRTEAAFKLNTVFFNDHPDSNIVPLR